MKKVDVNVIVSWSNTCLFCGTDRSSSEPVEDTDTTGFVAEFVSTPSLLPATYSIHVYLSGCLDLSSFPFCNDILF